MDGHEDCRTEYRKVMSLAAKTARELDEVRAELQEHVAAVPTLSFQDSANADRFGAWLDALRVLVK